MGALPYKMLQEIKTAYVSYSPTFWFTLTLGETLGGKWRKPYDWVQVAKSRPLLESRI